MLTLINIKRNGEIIEADYYLEKNNEELGHLRLNGTTGDVLESVSIGYGLTHAREKLKRLFLKDEVPKTATIEWY